MFQISLPLIFWIIVAAILFGIFLATLLARFVINKHRYM